MSWSCFNGVCLANFSCDITGAYVYGQRPYGKHIGKSEKFDVLAEMEVTIEDVKMLWMSAINNRYIGTAAYMDVE